MGKKELAQTVAAAPMASGRAAGTPSPGSEAALDAGCMCPVIDNHHGAGVTLGGGHGDGPHFWMNTECPLHGDGAGYGTASTTGAGQASGLNP